MIGWLVRVVESPLGDSKRRSPPLLRAVSPGTTQRKVLHSFSLSRFSKIRIISERQGILNLPKVGKKTFVIYFCLVPFLLQIYYVARDILVSLQNNIFSTA